MDKDQEILALKRELVTTLKTHNAECAFRVFGSFDGCAACKRRENNCPDTKRLKQLEKELNG